MIKILPVFLALCIYTVPAAAGGDYATYRLGHHGSIANTNVHRQHVEPAPRQTDAELRMLELQSLTSQRQLAQQMTKQMTEEIRKEQQCVIKNMGR